MNLKKRTHIMGILNITPDSFYDKSRVDSVNSALKKAEKMVDDGADILDIGGESTRPGSGAIPEEKELERVLPVVKALIKEFDLPLSVDTYKSTVAKAALEEGASIINDISGLRFDPKMADTIASTNAGVVIMHILEKPKIMQDNPAYENLMGDIKSYLEKSIHMAQTSSIADDRIIIDPGIGFGKDFNHNITIIKRLNEFKTLEKPILLGLSRKSFIGKILDLPAEDRLEGTLAASVIGIIKGARILRTHDIKETKRAVSVADAILSNSN